jgi:molybdopterin synthase sulfur carrier subunit
MTEEDPHAASTGEGASGECGAAQLIRLVLPQHLRTLAQVDAEITLDVAAPVTVRRILDALESRYPMLRGTVRDYGTGQRRPFLRFFACEEDLSHESMDAELPRAVAEGKEPLLIIGAIAGG